MKIGFIGLGIMGKPMVRNLLKAGHEVWVNNRSKAPMEELAKDGAHAVSRQELAENAEIIITMLPNGPQVKEVMLGDVVNYMHAGQIFIDCSSISPVVSKEIAAVLAEKGVEMLDAPVSGGEPKAIDGTLSFMVGGKQEVFDVCKDILAAMGASVTLCGDVGAGNTTKLANQIIVACNIQAVAEAFTLAQKAGVDPEVVYRAIRGGRRFHGYGCQGSHDDRGQRQARLQDRPAHQGFEQRFGLRPCCRCARPHDRLRSGNYAVAAQQ